MLALSLSHTHTLSGGGFRKSKIIDHFLLNLLHVFCYQTTIDKQVQASMQLSEVGFYQTYIGPGVPRLVQGF